MARQVSPVGRVSYPNVFAAKEFDGKRTFGLTLLFDKTADLTELKNAVAAAIKERWGNKPPSNLRSPLRDGDEKDKPEYAGKVFVTFRAGEDRRPAVVRPDLTPISQESGEFYSGCYAKVSYSVYAYDKQGNRGVAFSLGNIQKVRDGEPLDGRTAAEDDFVAIDNSQSIF
jgi:hypothetical protein